MLYGAKKKFSEIKKNCWHEIFCVVSWNQAGENKPNQTTRRPRKMKEYTLDQAAKDSRKAWEMSQVEEMPETDFDEGEDFDLFALSDDDDRDDDRDDDDRDDDRDDDCDREYFWQLAGADED